MPSSPPTPTRKTAPIAVVGIGALFPGSSDKAGFWRDILAGRDLITDVPPTHWLIDDYFDPNPTAPDKIYAKRGAFLQATDFNPMEFAIPPANIPSIDTAQLLALLVAKQVLDDAAGSQFASMDRNRMSVVLGVASATELVTELSARMQRPVWADALRQHGFDPAQVEAICDRISSQYAPWTENSFPGMLGNVVAGRIANRFDLGGTNCVIDAACASSLAAVHLAMLELDSGHSDLVITGGVDALNDVLMYTCFSKTTALSARGDCRPFDADADGTILGEGLGMLALKRLTDAERDGDRIYAVIKGLGTSSDGLSKSIYAPVAEGQAKALGRTYEAAGYAPQTVELLEAHGTGTRAGDLAEFQGLSRVFDAEGHAQKRWCALGSVKSQIGHTKGAAGSAGLIKAVMALHHKVLPPTIKVDQPNPALKLDESPFYLNTKARPWIRDAAHPRRASVSSFGFGGSNYHVALEEYTGPAPRRPRLRTHENELLLVAADSASQLIERCRGLDLREGSVAHTAHQSLQAWKGGSHRLALVATASRAGAVMAQAIERIERQPDQPFALPGGNVHYGVGASLGALGMIFSGQGSQYLDMGRDLAMSFDAARAVWDRAANLDFGSIALHDVVFPPPAFSEDERAQQERVLTETLWAQPAIGAVQLSQLALLRQIGIEPAAVAGHSFGEFTALAAAGSLSGEDLLCVARKRGELMASAASVRGAMTAVMNGPVDLEQQIRACGFGVVAANRNTPTQLVFSGPLPGIEQLEQWLNVRKLEFRRLPVSTAFHSPLVESAVEPLHAFLSNTDMRPPTVAVYANATAQAYPSAPSDIRLQLASQLASPVRFHEQIDAMYAAGVRIFLEVGPRTALSAFVEQTLVGKPHLVASLDRAGNDGVLMLCQALAKLAAAGVSMRPAELWREYAEPLDPSQQKKPLLTVPISGTNYGRPYPPTPGVPRKVAETSAKQWVESTPLPHQNPAKGEKEFQQWMAQLETEATELSHVTAEAAATLAGIEPMQTQTPTTFETPTPTTHSAAVSTATVPSPMNSSAPSEALRQALLAVVSEKTGYPTDMLDLSQELESGLGIDSIKRVEILSAFRERMPGLPEVAPSQLAALNTLGDVLAFMQAGSAAPPAPAVAAAPVTASQPVPATTPAIDSEVLRQALLAVVSEKTGYPTDMLDLSQELESGLGIDSIKRVEILSAFRERMPGLPEVAPSQLAALNTLGDVLAFMQAGAPTTAAAPLAAMVETPAPVRVQPHAPSPTAPTSTVDSEALRQTLLAVVSEKTGYPTDMLDLSQELESGLGIDSIKRVEILSAFRERMPGLPEVAPSQLAALNTLGDVLAFMKAGSAAPTVPSTAAMQPTETQVQAVVRAHTQAPVPAPAQVHAPAAGAPQATPQPTPATPPAFDSEALRQTLLTVVSEKTGYPTDMLDLSQELESGLGIDSIKRVEILSAFRERMPGLPEVAPSQLAALNTLGDVLAFMQAGASSVPREAASEAAAVTPVALPASLPARSTSLLPRHAVRAVNQAAAGFAMPGLLQPNAVIGVTEDDSGIAQLLVHGLKSQGVNARVVSDPAVSGACTGLIVLSGLQQATDPWEALRANRQAFQFVQAMSAHLADRDGLLVTVQDTGGDFGLSGRAGVRAYLGGIAALARTAANEWPQAAVKAIDLEIGGRAPAALAKTLVRELLEGGAEREVGLPARAERITLSTELTSVPEGRCVIDSHSVVVATGGARGVTALCLQELARLKPRIAILGRTPLDEEPASVRGAQTDAEIKRALLANEAAQGRQPTPMELTRMAQSVLASREAQANLQAMQSAGAQVMYCVADVGNAASVQQALAQVRQQFGPVTCLVHGAGVLADKLIKDKTLAQYDSVMATKVEGLLHLLDVLGGDPLQALVMFSSVAARVGNPGQCDYAIANEILNQVALVEAARRPGCVVRSIGWGPWDGGMVTPALRSHFGAQGVSLIQGAKGAAAFMEELNSGSADTHLVMGTGEPRDLLARDTGHRGTVTADVILNPQRYPFLESHRIGSEPVVPMVLVAEWFVRAAMSLMPGAGIPVLQDLRALRGVVLGDWGRADSRLRVTARFEPGSKQCLRCELHSLDGKVSHYSASANFNATPATIEAVTLPDATRTHAVSGESLYSTPALFHGPDLHAIRQAWGSSEHGVEAELYGCWSLGWDRQHLLLDIPAMDGALQVPVGWLYRSSGSAMLPTHVRELRLHRNQAPTYPIHCTTRLQASDALHAVCDIHLTGGEWTVMMTGVELHARVTVPVTASAAHI